jgi:glutaredoxin 3
LHCYPEYHKNKHIADETMKTIKVYSTPTCPFCKQAKSFLAERSIPFEDIDVTKDEKARDTMIEKSGQMSVPVIEVGDEILVGFDREKLAKALKLEE